MSRSYDYRNSSLEAIAAHLNTVQSQAYNKLITYYTTKQDTEMVARLTQARHLSKILKLTQEYDALYGKTEGTE